MEERYDNCFVCGISNPIGLKMKFTYSDDTAQAEFRLPVNFEGYDNIIHGGIVAAILDESMAKIILHKRVKAVTVNITIDYKKPLKPDTKYFVKGSILNIRKKIIETEATIVDNESVYAKASAKFFRIS